MPSEVLHCSEVQRPHRSDLSGKLFGRSTNRIVDLVGIASCTAPAASACCSGSLAPGTLIGRVDGPREWWRERHDDNRGVVPMESADDIRLLSRTLRAYTMQSNAQLSEPHTWSRAAIELVLANVRCVKCMLGDACRSIELSRPLSIGRKVCLPAIAVAARSQLGLQEAMAQS